jgi:hypothetical protein
MKLNEYRRKLAAPPEKSTGVRVLRGSLVDFIKAAMPDIDPAPLKTFTGIDWSKTKVASTEFKGKDLLAGFKAPKLTPIEGREGSFMVVDDVSDFKEAAPEDHEKIIDWYTRVLPTRERP